MNLFTNKFSIFVYLLAGFVSMGFTQKVLGPVQLDIPPFEKDKSGKAVLLDYSLELSGFTHKNMSLKDFKNENTLLFYFSAKCGHCKSAYPHIKKLYATLKEKNIKMAVIAVAMNKEPDIAKFVTELKVDVPVFHDKDRKFSRLYGTGNVPLVLLANKKGQIIKFKRFNHKATIDQISFAFNDKSKF